MRLALDFRWLLAATLVGLAATGTAQTTLRAEPITAPIKDRGIYRAATGTWDHSPGSQLAIGTKILFNNNAPSGYYNPQDINQEQTNEGRLPSLGSEGTADLYLISCYQIAYCTDEGGLRGVIKHNWGTYPTCTDPRIPPSNRKGWHVPVQPFMPGAVMPGTQTCWIVTVDLTATTDEFILEGDNDGVFANIPGSPELDEFGWSVQLTAFTGPNTGLIIAGDPANAPFGAGTDPAWGFAPGPAGTGLAEDDQFWITDFTNSSFDGCYWFGGYQNNNIWGGHWYQMIGDEADNLCGGMTGSYCGSAPFSTGFPSTLTINPPIVSISANPTMTAMADNLPQQPGIFIAGPTQAAIPFFNGTLCISPLGLQRFAQVNIPAANGFITQQFTIANAAPGGLLVVAGAVYNFQRWNRDPAAGGAFANFSDGFAVCFQP